MHHIVILAAGKGTRMNSNRPKVLTPIGSRPMISYLLDRISKICPSPSVIIGYQGSAIQDILGEGVEYIWQTEQRGTGHALMCAKSQLAHRPFETLIVLPGDHPLIEPVTLQRLLTIHERNHHRVSIGTVLVPHFDGDFSSFQHCGRIVRDTDGSITGIVEFKDATNAQRRIKEVNVSYYCFHAGWLWDNIEQLDRTNMAGEYYLTDMIKLAVAQGHRIGSIQIPNAIEGMGVNTPQQLDIISHHISE